MPGLRVAVIGAGANSRLHHVPGLLAQPDVEVVAVCNRTTESGQRVAAEFGIANVVTDPEAIFADPAIDAVCIGTWPYRHREYAVRALNAGKHVLCEARMAMDAAEAQEMLGAAQRRPDLVAQLVPAPFDLRSWRTIRRLLADGSLGSLREVHATILGGGALNADAPLQWRERAEYSGMNTMTMGIYAEVIGRWIGPAERVVADAAIFVTSRVDPESGRRLDIEVPDSLGILARYAGGVRATYRVSNVTHAPREGNGVSLFGSRGTLHWHANDTMTFAPVGEAPRPLEPDAGTARDWEVEHDFVASIREGRPVELTSFEAGVHYMQFTEAVWRSWSEQRPVDVASV